MAHKPMNSRLRADVLSRLHAEFDGVEKGSYMQKLRCPSCGKREAFVNSDDPWMIKCGRENSCGEQYHVKELFPEFFNTWSERFAPAAGEPQTNPNAVADAYLSQGRGFDLTKIQNWYTQEYYFDMRINQGTATVRFDLGNGGWWERLLDNPERFGKQKARFKPGYSYKGTWWLPPNVDLLAVTKLYLVEGIFDAIALNHLGIPAAAIYSCNAYPQDALNDLSTTRAKAGLEKPELVWALDGDAAGQRYIKKWAKQSKQDGWKVSAAIIPKGKKSSRDWNDAFQREELTPHHFERYHYYGSLCIAGNATQKALLIYNRTNRQSFVFEYNFNTYGFKLDVSKYQKALEKFIAEGELSEENAKVEALKESGGIKHLAPCKLEALYYQANRVTDESWYYWRVTFADGNAVKNTFSGSQLSGAGEFKKRLMGVSAGALWTGTSDQLDSLLKDEFYGIKTVETIDYIGYSKDHEAWIFNDLAIHKGKIYNANEEDFFQLGRVAVKSLGQSVQLEINTKKPQRDWIAPLYTAFGGKGVIALAFWLGSLYAEQIRAEQSSFPFLEIIGEAGSGKTTLIEFLWRLVGRDDHEGFDPVKATNAARRRTLSQVSNLPTVLIESDREDVSGGATKQKQFDWDELKPLYNGRPAGSVGVKNSGNETQAPPFRSTIVIAQNAMVEAGEAIMSRIVHLNFKRESQNKNSFQAANFLTRCETKQVSSFLVEALKAEAEIMQIIKTNVPKYVQELSDRPDINIYRLAETHSQIMALADCLGPDCLNILTLQQVHEAHATLIKMAGERQLVVTGDTPIITEFWEIYDYLQGSAISHHGKVNHYAEDSKEIAINLTHFEQMATERRVNLPPMRELKRYLKGSKNRKFVQSGRTVRSVLRIGSDMSETLKCWIFTK